jgi:cysteine desulfurase
MIYFDNSATTAPCDAVMKMASEELSSGGSFGNPGSLHKLGVEAKKRYAGYHDDCANLLGVKADELYFTSCATESANTAIFGYLAANERAGKTVISTRTEHKATLEPLAKLEADGYNVVYLPVGSDGIPSYGDMEKALSENGDVALICLTFVNNETGAKLPDDLYCDLRKRYAPNAAFYLDVVQALGKIRFDLSLCDMASFSGHKIHSVKGCGMLYVKSGIRVKPLILGGGQQSGMRSGTESPFLAGLFTAALEEAYENMDPAYDKVKEINAYLRDELVKRDVTVLSPENAIPFVLNVSFPGFESETMLHCLEMYDIYVSTVSACTSKAKKVSYVLLESGVDRRLASNAVRLSFSRYNTMDEAKRFIEAVDDIYDKFLVKR